MDSSQSRYYLVDMSAPLTDIVRICMERTTWPGNRAAAPSTRVLAHPARAAGIHMTASLGASPREPLSLAAHQLRCHHHQQVPPQLRLVSRCWVHLGAYLTLQMAGERN